MRSIQKTAFWASIGVGLEYYDFVVYGMMADYLTPLFFASEDRLTSTLKVFAVFALGYIVRPLGGLLFGMMGDHIGRKKSFLAVMTLMALSTFSIGLLPTYAQIGGLASFSLLILRLLQGLSFGAELPGAITLICEHCDDEKQSHHKSFFSSFMFSNMALGSLLASFILYLFATYLTREEILAFAWRVPFFIGGSLAIVSYFMRRKIHESRSFKESLSKKRDTRKSLLSLLFEYFFPLLRGVGFVFFVSLLVIFSLYLPSYLHEHFGHENAPTYLATMGGLFWSCLTTPIVGKVVDKIGQKRGMSVASCLFIATSFFLFHLLERGDLFSLILFSLILQTIISFLTVSYSPLMASLFPTSFRFTGVAISYNVAYSLAATMPMVMMSLIPFFKTPFVVLWFLIGGAIINLLCVSFYTTQTRKV